MNNLQFAVKISYFFWTLLLAVLGRSALATPLATGGGPPAGSVLCTLPRVILKAGTMTDVSFGAVGAPEEWSAEKLTVSLYDGKTLLFSLEDPGVREDGWVTWMIPAGATSRSVSIVLSSLSLRKPLPSASP